MSLFAKYSTVTKFLIFSTAGKFKIQDCYMHIATGTGCLMIVFN
jgi:hypothetical protein